MSRRSTRWPLTSALQGSGHHARQRPLRIKGGAQLQSVRDGMRLGTAGDKFSAETTKRRIAVGLVLQLSLLVDQEFGGLSFPVAGFGDGLMEPAPERPSENEVDADAQLEAGDEAADLGHAEGNECARSLAPFWPARLTRIAARKASASIDRVTWRDKPCQYQPCQLRTS